MDDVRGTGIDGISIGTALSLESLFNIDTPIVNPYSDKGKIKPTNYDVFLINIHTLVRNILTSYEGKDKLEIIKKSDIEVTVFEILKTEMFNIVELCKLNHLEILFYCPDYSKALNNGLSRSNDNNAFMLSKTINVSNYAFKRLLGDEYVTNLLEDRNVKIKVSDNKILMLTHFTLDLLNYKHWFKCTLLQSHTGRIIESVDFNKMYYKTGSVDTDTFPFLEELLYILGDKHMYKPVPIGVRRWVGKRATETGWKKNSYKGTIRNDLNKETDIKDTLNRANFIF